MTAEVAPAESTNYLLPPEAYTTTEWFEREQHELFEHVWVFAGVEHELAEPGDFITVQIGRSPIVVVRDNEGELRAFHNLCRHRGLPVADGNGNCGKAFVCPYHRWNYGLNGALRSVPQREQYPELDFDELGLKPVRCETWKTLVFAHLDADAEPLDEWIGDFDSLFPNFRPETLVEISHQVHDVNANWKLYVENHVDWLHLWYLHAESLAHYDHPRGERREFGPHWASFEWFTEAAQADKALSEARNDRVLLPIPDLDHRESTNGAHLIFPSLTLFTNDGYWMLGQVVPVDEEHFQLHLRVFALDGSDGPAFEPIINVVMFEDYAATEAIQKAMASPAFEVGPLATDYEREIMRFQQHYLEFVSPA